MTLRQTSTETVDQYALKFKRLLKKVSGGANNLVPAVLQVRMFLYGLVPIITPLVSIHNPATLDQAIERARLVETEYNYAPSATTTTFENPTPVSNLEVDELTKRIQELLLNYATLASAMTAQPTRNNRNNNQIWQRNQSSRFSRSPGRTNADKKCYNCDRSGHLARNCRAPKRTDNRKTRFTTPRDVHYADYQENPNEREYYYTEEEEYEQEAYPAMRSGRTYIPNHSTRPIVDKLDELKRNTRYNATNPKVSNKTTTINGPGRKSKMRPAPIESLTEFDVANYLQQLPAGINIGQAAHLLLSYHAGMRRAVSQSRGEEKEANFASSDDDEELTTAAKVTLRIDKKAQMAIVDSGAATCIITKACLIA